MAKKAYKSVVPIANNKPYITAVVAMSFIAVIGAVLVQIFRPEIDNTNIIIEIFGFSAAITTGLLATMKSQETHVAVNHRLDEWMEKAEELALARGIEEGVARADARTDLLAQQKSAAKALAEIKIDTGELKRRAEEGGNT